MAPVAEEVRQKEKVDFRRILVATDFSEPSRRALAHALRIARRYGSELTIAHAIPPAGSYQPIPLDPLPRELDRQSLRAQEEMDRLGREVPMQGIPQHTHIQEGPFGDVMSSLVRQEHVDLIVVGTHGRGGFKKLLLGSVAEQLVRMADGPVLTVGPHVPEPEQAAYGFGTILFATDFGPACVKAFPYALSMAEDFQAKLILLHVVPMVTIGPAAYAAGEFAASELSQWEAMVEEESARRLRELLPPDAKLASEPEYLVATSFVPEGILGTAANHNAELIVMGVNATSSARLSSHFPWNVAHGVICGANCPVLTVRG